MNLFIFIILRTPLRLSHSPNLFLQLCRVNGHSYEAKKNTIAPTTGGTVINLRESHTRKFLPHGMCPSNKYYKKNRFIYLIMPERRQANRRRNWLVPQKNSENKLSSCMVTSMQKWEFSACACVCVCWPFNENGCFRKFQIIIHLHISHYSFIRLTDAAYYGVCTACLSWDASTHGISMCKFFTIHLFTIQLNYN